MACAFCRRRSSRSIPKRVASRPTPVCTRPTSWSSRSAPTTTSTPHLGSPRPETSSTPSPAPSGWPSVLPEFSSGRAIVGVCGAPFKCPPAPSEAALLLHDYLSARGVRRRCEISFVIPFGTPVPPSPDTSEALVAAFAEHGIEFVSGRRVAALDAGAQRRCARRRHRAALRPLPRRPQASRPRRRRRERHDRGRLRSREPADARDGLPRRVRDRGRRNDRRPEGGRLRRRSSARRRRLADRGAPGGEQAEPYGGRGSCYIEFGAGRVGRVDVDFLSGPKPTGTFHEPSAALVAEKHHFGSSRSARWFGH